MPVDLSSVTAIAFARDSSDPTGPSMSTSSYSRRPVCATVRPPALTKRRDGNVGRPSSSDRPSAVSPRRTTANAHSASEWSAGSGSGR